MKQAGFWELCAFMASIWGRELTPAQKAAGFKLVADMPDAAVENAVVKIAEEGADRMPPWSVVYRVAYGLAHAMRDEFPALPAGDSLSDNEHTAVMIGLRARETDEQRRRADRMTSETKGLTMSKRLKLASELLIPPLARAEPKVWDQIFDRRVAEASDSLPKGGA